MTDESYLNISEMELSIKLLYIISDTPKCDIIWTENSDVIDSFILEILKYESSVIVSSTENPGRTSKSKSIWNFLTGIHNILLTLIGLNLWPTK